MQCNSTCFLTMGTLILQHLQHALRRAIWIIWEIIVEQGNRSRCEPYFRMGIGYRNIFVHFEYCASPLCPFDLLPSPKIEGNYAVPITSQLIPLTLRHAGRIPCEGLGGVTSRELMIF